MSEESRIENRESSPPRPTRFEGYLFWPITAALSFFGTLSAAGTLLTPLGHIPGPLATWLFGGAILFGMSAVLASMIGAMTLLCHGIECPGQLTVRGRQLSRVATGGILMFCYLTPWILFGMLKIR
jgi:hypothetical protein